MNRTILSLSVALFTGCTSPGSPKSGEGIQQLLTTGYHACVIDGLGDFHCKWTTGEPVDMGEGWLSGGRNFIAGATSQTSVCLIEDPDGDGAGDILCTALNDHRFSDEPDDTFAGDFVQVIAEGAICGLDTAGELTCFESWGNSLDDQFDSLPAGPFESIHGYGNSLFSMVCGVDADGTSSCIGAGPAYSRAMDVCPLPTSGIADMDFGDGVAILLEDGSIEGWKHGLPTTEDDCLSKPASDAYAVELAYNAVCTMDPGGIPTCDPIDSSDDTSLSTEVPSGHFMDLSAQGAFADFACVLAASDEVTCWGVGWEGDSTFTFGTLID